MQTSPLDTSPLPEEWSPLEIVVDAIDAAGLVLHRAGVASVGPLGREAIGSGADLAAPPLSRSYFELLERVSTLEALRRGRARYDLLSTDGRRIGEALAHVVFPESDEPARWQYSRSNGVALHDDWAEACSRARWELAERDRVLRSWYGETTPELLPERSWRPPRALPGYSFDVASFPAPDGATFASGVHVVGVFGFPSEAGAPLILGFAARDDQEHSCQAAWGEALQVLAFLWGEPVGNAEPPLGPTPAHHLDRLQWRGHHSTVRGWLAGRFPSLPCRRAPPPDDEEVSFVDLTPEWLGGGMRVARAVCATATPLTFGDSPFAAHLPPHRRAHPVA